MAKPRYSTIILIELYLRFTLENNNIIYQTCSFFHFHQSMFCNSFLFFFVCNSSMDFYYNYYNLDLKRFSCAKPNITATLFNLIKTPIQYTKIYVEHGLGDL